MNPAHPADLWFAPTRWSLVSRARGDSPEARAALADLCEAYWQPVFRVLRRSGHDDDSAREVAQDFFAHLLAGGRLDAADPARGRFRSYLLGALRHFESDRRKHTQRLKRGSGQAAEPLDPDHPHPGAAAPPWKDAQFDREWALAVVTRSLDALGADYAATGRSPHFERLKPCLTGADLPSQADLARELGITEGALKVAIHRLRRRFRETVRAEIRQTLPEGVDADEELRYLVEVLARA